MKPPLFSIAIVALAATAMQTMPASAQEGDGWIYLVCQMTNSETKAISQSNIAFKPSGESHFNDSGPIKADITPAQIEAHISVSEDLQIYWTVSRINGQATKTIHSNLRQQPLAPRVLNFEGNCEVNTKTKF